MRKIILNIILIVSSISNAQEVDNVSSEALDELKSIISRSRHTFSGEIGGPAVVLSANFEYAFIVRPKSFSTFKLGLGTQLVGMNLSHGFTYNYGKKLCIEVGGGGSIYGGVNIRSGGTESLYSFYGSLGLRYQPIKRGVMFRASYLNLIPSDFDYSSYSWFAIGIGYTWPV